ncbi:hypothetical protein EGI32_21430 [Ferruginibacter sp. HRS2-29]|nr:hypothetical protein [Ferruginibacter sp. HRS2-29]
MLYVSSSAQLQKKDSVFFKSPASRVPIGQNELNKFNFHGDEIWLYTDINFKGKKKVLKVTGNNMLEFSLAALGPEWNDVISSCLVPNGVKIYLYENDHFNPGSVGSRIEIIGRGKEYYAKGPSVYVPNKGTVTPNGAVGVYIDNNDFTNVANADYFVQTTNAKNDPAPVYKGVQSDAADVHSGKKIDFNDKTSSIRIVRFSN